MAICRYFNPPATDKRPSDARIRFVMVNPEVYRSYLWLYSCAFDMVKQMEKVLDDSHHKEIVQRGPIFGYIMPDVDRMRKTTQTLRDCLESFDCDDALMVGRRVKLPLKTARGLYNVAVISDQLVDDVFMGLRKSEYMLWLRALRATGEPYEGPTSLQEVVDVWLVFDDVNLHQIVYPTSYKGCKLQPNWAAQP